MREQSCSGKYFNFDQFKRFSGVFGWNDASEHEVHVFDDTGREVEGFNAPQVREDGKTWTEVRLAEDWSAAIVRK